jgi:serine-type D-Ala-D-Ala carboxypeptidase/endopeptidase (penicillin-binding protein 4)
MRQWLLACTLVWTWQNCIAGPLGPLEGTAARYKVPVSGISAIVQALSDDKPIFAVNADVPRNPASTIKLLTTFVALDVLGPTYSWPTHVYASGPINNGVLAGDLILKGYGDPYLVEENLWKMLGELRRRGLREITGDLVFDDSHFVATRTDPGAFDGQPYRLYNVLPNALMVNFKAFVFYFSPRVDGGITIRSVPELSNLKIINQLKLTQGRCRGLLASFTMTVPDAAAADTVVFAGEYQASCGEQMLPRSVMQPASYAYGMFKNLWAQHGGSLKGGVRVGTAPTGSPFYVWQSPPLADVIRPLNKWSNNLMADALLYTLGGTLFDPPLTPAFGEIAVKSYLAEHRIPNAGLVLENGSGLSRITRISATTMHDLLRHAYRSRYMSEFISSLAIAGIDGTMRRRFKHASETGWMHLKTGHLNNVAAVAGFVQAKSGTPYVVVLFLNGSTGGGSALIDALLAWTYQQ